MLSLSARNVIIATTSGRQMVAYSDVGVRLWQLSLDDLAPTSPVRISDQDAVLVDLGGEVRRFDLSTGNVLWQHTIGSDVNVSPAAGAGLVVIMDRGGATTGYEQAPAMIAGPAEQGSAATVIGDNVIVIQDQTAHALWPTTGRPRWARPIFETLTDMASFAGQVVVATKSQSVILSGQGVVTQRLGPVLTLTPTQDHLVAWGPTEASIIARDGAVISRWDLPALTLSQQGRPAVPVYKACCFQQRLDVPGPRRLPADLDSPAALGRSPSRTLATRSGPSTGSGQSRLARFATGLYADVGRSDRAGRPA